MPRIISGRADQSYRVLSSNIRLLYALKVNPSSYTVIVLSHIRSEIKQIKMNPNMVR